MNPERSGTSVADTTGFDGARVPLVDHWVHQPEWEPDRRLWSFYLTFSDSEALHAAVAASQAVLDLPGLDLVQARWLHLTILGTVFTDEIDEPTLEELTSAVRDLMDTHPVFDLVVHPPMIDHDAVCLPVSASTSIATLRSQLTGLASSVVGRELYALPLPALGFSPHVTIAYAGPGAPSSAEVQERLSLVRFAELRCRATEVALVRLRRGERRWSWDQELRFPLGGGQPVRESAPAFTGSR